MPLPVPIPPSPGGVGGAARGVRRARHRAGIPQRWCAALDPDAQGRACSPTATEMPYDLFLGVPVHRAPEVVEASGMTRRRLDPGRPADARDAVPRRVRGRRRHQRRHARRRACSPRARPRSSPTGSSPRSPGPSRIGESTTARGICYLEFGHDQVAQGRRHVRQRARPPTGELDGPVDRRSPPTRPSSARAASSAGSAGTGPTSDPFDPPVRSESGRTGAIRPSPRRSVPARCPDALHAWRPPAAHRRGTGRPAPARRRR